ncbi:hypothetical protein ABB27_04910 [Stenotrophomonas terrae]|uniref:Hemagglutinin n=1 Tax=Stenotrophomonas terrae TaxID=405446 RepID=A0A0R0CW74_9GAMM|nr:ESPR-type extended signal peptide-containing protein [Stenotrophomonas terrae]KRG70270.1 hypothetical protein ABB27_04910 [Stenotrophomonas terrae]
MNRIYRLVWNRTLNAFVVGSELASAQGKSSGPDKLSPVVSWRLAGLGSAIALAMAGPAAATDAKLADLQDLVAKYSNTDAQQIVATQLPAVNAGVSLNTALNLPAVLQVDAAAAVSLKPRTAAAPAAVRAQLGVRAALPQLRPHGSTAAPAAALAVVADAALAVKPLAASTNATVTATVGPLTGTGAGLQGLAAVLLPGKEEGGSPLHGTLVSTAGAVKELTGEVVTGKPLAAVQTLTSHAGTTVASLTQHVGGSVAGLTGALLPGSQQGGSPLQGTLVSTAGAVKELTGEVLTGQPVAAVQTLTSHAGSTVASLTQHVGGEVAGLTGALLPGSQPGGSPLQGTLVSTAGAVKELTDEVLTGQPVAAVQTLASHAGTTVTSLTGHVGGGVAGVTGLLLPGSQEGGNPVRGTLTGALGAVEDLTGGVAKGTGLGGLVNGLVNGVAPVLDGVGGLLGAVVGGVTGSSTLGTGITGTVGALTGGLKDTTGALANGDVAGTVQNLLGTVDTTASTLLGATGNTLGGITGSGSGVGGLTGTLSGVVGGVTGGLSNVVGGLTGNPVIPSAAPPAAPGPSGLIVGNGGLVGSVNQLVDAPLTSLLGGNPYIQSGSLKVNSTNVMQTYSSLELLNTLPLVNLSPVGEVLDGLGGLATGSNSHLTLIGGVTSDSYITNINNGDPGGLLGLVLPDGAPAWASDCLDLLGVAQVKCWAVPAAQDYQVLIGDGAFANGSKEVVIGSNAEHRLAAQTADQVFVDATGGKTGVPTADYDARQGHSVVVGDSAKGTANAQTLLGAGATSDKANSVALGYKSDAARGGQDNYAAFGLTTAQTSIGEVAVGSTGRERQITHVAAGSLDTDAVNVKQLRGALDQIDDLGLAAVVYDEDANGVVNYSKVTLGGGQAANGTVLANVAAGAVAAGGMEAVNGGQLFALGSSMATTLGGGASFTGGVLAAPNYQINSIGVLGTATLQPYANIGNAFSSISDSLLNLSNLLPRSVPGGSDPLAVLYTADGAGNPTNQVRLSGDGSGAAVALGNVANGSVVSGSLDAINGGQLATTNAALASTIGGTLQYNSSTGQWSAASFNITSINSGGAATQQTFGNVTDAFAAMDSSIVNVNNRIDNIQNGGAGNAYFAVNSTKPAASATGQDSVAAGPQATASGNQAVAIGDGANASAAGSVALGAGSVANRANTVSVGAAGAERQISNVGDGSEATDAVNLRQLQASQQGTVRYDQNTDGSTNYSSVTMGRPGTSTVIHNVGAGVAPTDAVNVAQLNKGMGDVMDWSKNYTDQRFNDVSRDMKRIDDRASAGVASAMAMAGLPQPTEAGRRMASMAASTFHGESSMAVGVSGVTDGGRWIYKLSGSANTRGDGGVTVGAGFQW